MQEYLFQAIAANAPVPVKTGTHAARKGLHTRLPAAAQVLASRSAGQLQEKDLLATVKHYLVHQTCVIKQRSVQQKTPLRLVLLIDSSASMAADQQIGLVKGLVTAMLQRHKQRRPQAAVIVMSQGKAATILPFTSHLPQITAALGSLRTGGKTNLAAGFEQAAMLTGSKGSGTDHQLYVFTDGRANAGNTAQPLEEAITFFRAHLAHLRKQTYIINTENGYPRLGMAVTLAERLGCSLFGPEHNA